MTLESLLSGPTTIVIIIASMGAVALVELLVPLHRRGRWNRLHLAPNLGLTILTFATNLVLNFGLIALIVATEQKGFGLFVLPRFHPWRRRSSRLPGSTSLSTPRAFPGISFHRSGDSTRCTIPIPQSTSQRRFGSTRWKRSCGSLRWRSQSSRSGQA